MKIPKNYIKILEISWAGGIQTFYLVFPLPVHKILTTPNLL